MRWSKSSLSCLPRGRNITPLVDGSSHASIIVAAPTTLVGECAGVPTIVCPPPGVLLLLLLGGGLVGGERDIPVLGALAGGWCGAVLGLLLVKVGGWCHIPLVFCGWVKGGQGLTFGRVLLVRLGIKSGPQ